MEGRMEESKLSDVVGVFLPLSFNTSAHVPFPPFPPSLIALCFFAEKSDLRPPPPRTILARRLHGKRSSPRGELEEEGERANFRNGGEGTKAKAPDGLGAHYGAQLCRGEGQNFAEKEDWGFGRGGGRWSKRVRGEEEMPPTKK